MYDLTIIGAGTGGYAAAIRAAGLGARVCVVEKDLLGGTCLNKGCIPTKTIINSIKVLRTIKKSNTFGLDVRGFSVDFDRIFRRKEEVVQTLRRGMESVLKSKGIDIIKGAARVLDKSTIKVNDSSISSKYIVIATGSHPIERDGLKFDHKLVLSSDGMLNLQKIPQKLVIVGGGYIGCEFASIYSQLGSEVTIVEIESQLLPSADKEIARRLEAALKKAGVKVIKGISISSLEAKDRVDICLDDGSAIEADVTLLSIGRKPDITGLNLEGIGIRTENGRIIVNDRLRTNIENIYAIGDVTGRHYLAHVASYEGMVASDNIFGKPYPADYLAVPSCIFTFPEIASVGLTEEKARESGLEFSLVKIPFAAISKAHVTGELEGIIKLISDKKTDRILGVHILGNSASELIAGFVIAMKNRLTVSALGETIYAHPTLSEAILEVAQRATQKHGV